MTPTNEEILALADKLMAWDTAEHIAEAVADLKVHPLWRESADTLRQLVKERDSCKHVASPLDQEMQEMVKRDKQMADLWFYGPASTPAMAYRDRRALLSYVRALQTELATLREERDHNDK